MKIITYRSGHSIKTGVVLTGDRILPIDTWLAAQTDTPQMLEKSLSTGVAPAPAGVLRLLQGGPARMAALGQYVAGQDVGTGPFDALSSITLYAPLPNPGKILGVGRNYGDHAKETGVAPFEIPRIFAKLTSTVSAPGSIVTRPEDVTKMDFEGELAVVMGRAATNVSEAHALSYVAGYTILDDLSARELQFDISPPQTTFAKSKDGFTPIGPWLVTADEIPDPQTLDLTTWVNGVQVQHANTSDMLFSVATLIAYLSRTLTLEPGDMIATGTPAGVGAFRKPPQYLQPGDHIKIEISSIGALVHSIG